MLGIVKFLKDLDTLCEILVMDVKIEHVAAVDVL
jgi:hypothetical protein